MDHCLVRNSAGFYTKKKILSKNSGTMPADLVVSVYHSCTLLQIGSF